MGLREFCFDEPGMFIIPAEALLPDSIHPQIAEAIVATRGLPPEWPQRFGEAFSKFISRWYALGQQVPKSWWPPRLQNVIVIDRADAVRPFFRPLSRACWVVYADDFNPETGSGELAAYTLLHAERLHTKPVMGLALMADLPYWLLRSDEEIDSFKEGALRASRPGANVFKLLAAHLAEIRSAYHPTLKPAPEATLPIPLGNTTLLKPQGSSLDADALLADLRSSCLEDYESVRVTLSEADVASETVAQYLEEDCPQVVVTDEHHAVLWSPDMGQETTALKARLDALPPAVAKSFIEDLREIDQVTSRFMALLPASFALDVHEESTEEADGVYIHHELKLLAYSLNQPGSDPTREVSPPYARKLLAARAAHEWGHVAADSGLFPEPAPIVLQVRIDAIERALEPFLRQLPTSLAPLVAQEGVSPQHPQAIQALRAELLSRQDDFLANKIAMELTSQEAMECYLRSNAYCHAEERIGPISQLLRAAHEYQYLTLAEVHDPWRYYTTTTRFWKLLAGSGWVKEDQVRKLLTAVADYFGSFQLPHPE